MLLYEARNGGWASKKRFVFVDIEDIYFEADNNC